MSDLELSDNELSDMEMSEEETTSLKQQIKKKGADSETKEYISDDDNNDDGDGDDDDEEQDNGLDIEEDKDELELSDEDDDDDDVNSDIGDFDPDTGVMIPKEQKIPKKKNSSKIAIIEEPMQNSIEIPTIFEKNDSDYDSSDDEDEDEEYLQKFDKEIKENYILDQHPECLINNYDEIYNLAKVQRNKDNIIVDDLHKTIPILTKYEKTRILGQRTKQLNNGARPMIKLTTNIIDGYLIALKELEEKKIPVIIRRPLPNNTSEYWHLKDLEII
jgi:DNA-directed RNA polymerase I, II, and III subunit RPABC2